MTLDDLSDRLNPVFLKESRQVFHNRIAVGTLSALLVAELIMHIIIMVNYSTMSESSLSELGLISYVIQQVMVGVAVLGICIGRAASGFAQERMQKELDYSRISVITPSRILVGKMMSQVLMMLDIYAIVMPFMFIAYFLRGISIPTMLGWTLLLMLVYTLMMQFGLFVASFGKKNTSGGVLVLTYFMAQVMVPVLIGFFDLDRHSGDEKWMTFFAGAVIFVFFTLLLYSLTVAVINSFGNRMYWLRLLGLLQLLFLLVLNALFYLLSERLDWFNGINFASVSSFLFLVQFVVTSVICLFERKEPGTRVMAERPGNLFRRIIRFLLSSGQANGLAFAWCYMFIWGGGLFLVLCGFPDQDDLFTRIWKMYIIAAYLLFYVQCALLLTRHFKRLRPEYAGLFVFFLLFVIPFLIVAILTFDHGKFEDYAIYLLTTPICAFSRNPENGFLGLFLAFVSFIPLAKYTYGSFKRFISDDREVAA